jgi:large subunit ribosomal protein L25
MEYRELNVELREKTGKGICRQLRSKDLVPGIVYGKGIEPVAVTVAPKDLAAAIAGEGGQNHLVTLKGGGSLDGTMTIVADLLRDPIKGTYRHVDLHKINLTQNVRVEVAVNLVGSSVGVREGGLLDLVLHTVEVECLPNQIPGHIDLDITELTVGHSLHVSDLQVPADVRILADPKASVVSILGKAREEATEATEATEAI